MKQKLLCHDTSVHLSFRHGSGNKLEECTITVFSYSQCDQIGQLIALWATIQSRWQKFICPNLLHSQAIFVNVSKSFIFGQLLQTFGNFLSGHTGLQRRRRNQFPWNERHRHHLFFRLLGDSDTYQLPKNRRSTTPRTTTTSSVRVAMFRIKINFGVIKSD